MQPNSFWTSIIYVVKLFTLSPLTEPGVGDQAPLLTSSTTLHDQPARGPVFAPPGGDADLNFTCDYSIMSPQWTNCSTPENRGCWLRNVDTLKEYNISTNYEDSNSTPNGTHRTYYLDLTDDWINADGMDFKQGKVFNGTYPGPWIQACWGDNVTVIVNNKLSYNGTSIHWHGIRQWLTMHMDGVNGVTQCPIAPGQSFNYTWRVMQYGSSWYHSHHSVQYADGALGPMTLHGPSTAEYDEAVSPTLMTDWGHNSAFEAIQTNKLETPSILLNGTGNVTRYNNAIKNTTTIPDPYTINFDGPIPSKVKKYLLRIINTSFDSTFIFSIDNHWLQIVGADFVPIHPYQNTSVLVGIGQRYHVIVTAQPNSTESPLDPNGNYWIRTWKADCFGFNSTQASNGYEKSGILRYGSSQAQPNTTEWSDISHACSDETYGSLCPYLPWAVGKPPVNDEVGGVGENFTVQGAPKGANFFPLARISMGGDTFNPLMVEYGDPTFLHLNYTGKWNPLSVVIPEDYENNDWVYMVIKGKGKNYGAHPIHLHGHDFAILQQIESAQFPEGLSLKYDNPPRRDVVLLPTSGYVVIAFKTDNPGTWLMHCHIAYHASFGLAVQIMERREAAAEIWPSINQSHALRTAQQGCNDWNKWWGNCANWWPGDGSTCEGGEPEFSPDSGI